MNEYVPEVVVHVKNIGKERLGGFRLQVELLHLVLDHDGLPRYLLSRTTHSQHPRDPLQEHGPHLRQRWVTIYSIYLEMIASLLLHVFFTSVKDIVKQPRRPFWFWRYDAVLPKFCTIVKNEGAPYLQNKKIIQGIILGCLEFIFHSSCRPKSVGPLSSYFLPS